MGAEEANATAILNQRVAGLTKEIVGMRKDLQSLDETLKSAMTLAESIQTGGGILRSAARAALGR